MRLFNRIIRVLNRIKKYIKRGKMYIKCILNVFNTVCKRVLIRFWNLLKLKIAIKSIIFLIRFDVVRSVPIRLGTAPSGQRR